MREKTFEKLVTSLLSSFILSLKVFDISSALLIALTFNSKMKLQEDEFCFRFQKGKQVQPTTRMLFFLDTKKWWSSNDDVMTRALLIFIYGDSERKPNTYYRSCRRKRVPSSCCKLHDSCSFNQQVQPGKTDHQQQKINNENRPGMQRKTSFLKRDQSNIRNDCVQSCLGHEKSWGRNHHNDHHDSKKESTTAMFKRVRDRHKLKGLQHRTTRLLFIYFLTMINGKTSVLLAKAIKSVIVKMICNKHHVRKAITCRQ